MAVKDWRIAKASLQGEFEKGAEQGKAVEMRKLTLLLAIMTALGQSGCQLLGGTAAGKITPASGYDSQYQMNQLQEDYREQRITRPADAVTLVLIFLSDLSNGQT